MPPRKGKKTRNVLKNLHKQEKNISTVKKISQLSMKFISYSQSGNPKFCSKAGALLC